MLNKLYAVVGTKIKKQKVDTATDKEVKKPDGEEVAVEMVKSEEDVKKEDTEVTLSKVSSESKLARYVLQ